MKRFLFGLIALLFLAGPVNAADLATVNESLGSPDVIEINNMTPGSSKTFLGSRLQGLLTRGTETIAAATSTAECNTLNSTSSVTVTKRAYKITTGALCGQSQVLEDGYLGQRITYALATDGGKDFRIHPDTKTGFSTIDLNDAKDSVTVEYIDTTNGWMIVGNNGATVN